MTPEQAAQLQALAQQSAQQHQMVPPMPAPMPPPAPRSPLQVTPGLPPQPQLPPTYQPPPAPPPEVQQVQDPERAPLLSPAGTEQAPAPEQAPFRTSGRQRLANALRGWSGRPTVDYEARALALQEKQARLDEYQRQVDEQRKADEQKRLQDNAAQVRAAELQDPGSKASRNLQEIHRPFLEAAGLSPEEIEQMPGSALQGLDLQKGYGELAKQRAAEATAMRKQKELLAKEGRDAKEKRSYFDYTQKGKERIAALQGGIRPGQPLERDAQGNIVTPGPRAGIAASLEAQAKSAGLLAETPDKDDGEQAALRRRIGDVQGSLKRGKPAAELVDQIQREIDQAKKDEPARYRIPGWSRRSDAPEMQASKVEKVRDGVVALRKMEAISKRIREIDAELGTMERIGGAVGLDSDLTAEQMQLQRSATTQLRIIANMGVPSLNEMAIVNQQAPELTSISGWLNGSARFGAMVRQMRMEMDETMDVMGYERAARRKGAQVIE